MDKKEFLEAVDIVSKFIVNYLETCGDEEVMPHVNPGYLAAITEDECPLKGVSFVEMFAEFQQKIMPAVTHWASPHFHAYFPAGNCFASITAELLIAGLNNNGVNWEASPALSELETLVLNWLGKMMDLPSGFLNSSKGPGGAVLQNTSTECTLLSLIAARKQTLRKWTVLRPDLTENEILSKMVIYSSVQAHSSIERIGLMTCLTTHLLPVNQEGKITASTLRNAIETDLLNDRIPCYFVATMGATTTCSWEDLNEVGPLCEEYNIWMHVDAAYLGAALTCPELRYISKGLNYAQSFAVGLHKWFLMSFDVVAYWLKDTAALEDALHVDRIYLKHTHGCKAADFTHLQIATGKKFKALKVWMTLKSFGINGVQEHIRRHVMLGQNMELLIRGDQRFKILMSGFGLVGFALKSGNEATEKLRQHINEEKKIMLTPCHFNDIYVIRFVVNFSTRAKDVEFAWKVIKDGADRLEDTYIKGKYIDTLVEDLALITNGMKIPDSKKL